MSIDEKIRSIENRLTSLDQERTSLLNDLKTLRSQRDTHLESYPVRPFHEPRVFRGTYQLYKRLGFAEVGSENDGDYEIVLMRLPLVGRKK